MGSFIDLTGIKFGRLTVLERSENDKHGNTQWLCACDCGNQKICLGRSLKRGATQSCGCLHSEVVRKNTIERNKSKSNTYDLSNDFGIGYTYNGNEFYFDLDDYEKIKEYCWHKTVEGYIATRPSYDKFISMHRLIMNCPNEMQVDHINRIKNDNKKNNLRIVTVKENAMNNNRYKNNTSGVTGVSWHKQHQKWYASIRYNNNIFFLGLFEDIEEAINVRKNAEIKYFGEYRNKEGE